MGWAFYHYFGLWTLYAQTIRFSEMVMIEAFVLWTSASAFAILRHPHWLIQGDFRVFGPALCHKEVSF